MSGEANVENACPAAAASVGHAARSLPHTPENSARTETTRQLGFIRKPIKKNSDISEFASRIGGQGRDRTGDTRIFSPLLYQLSYLATVENLRMVGAEGFEPTTQ